MHMPAYGAPRAAHGFTLAELLIALLIGVAAIAGSLSLLQQASRSYRTAEQLAALEEQAAFALRALATDIEHAGYWGLHADSSAITVPAGIAVSCAGANVSTWALDLATAVDAADAALTMPCPPYAAAAPLADSLVVRHASPAPVPPQNRQLQLAADVSGGTLFTDGNPPLTTQPTQRVHDVQVHAWYVDRGSSLGNTPSLRRYALVRNQRLQNEEIMPGVEDLQVLLGIDSSGDGLPDRYVNPDERAAEPIRTVRLWLLLRGIEPETGHLDTGPYTSPDARRAPYRPNDSYRRLAVERTVALRNR